MPGEMIIDGLEFVENDEGIHLEILRRRLRPLRQDRRATYTELEFEPARRAIHGATPMNRVSLERGEPAQREALANLVQLYIHDFNDFLAADRKIGVGEDGRFADVLRLDDYWTEPDRSVWFIRAGGAARGICAAEQAFALRAASRLQHGRVLRRRGLPARWRWRAGGDRPDQDAPGPVGDRGQRAQSRQR